MSWTIGGPRSKGPQGGTWRATAWAKGPDGKMVTAEVRCSSREEAGRVARLMEINIQSTGRAE